MRLAVLEAGSWSYVVVGVAMLAASAVAVALTPTRYAVAEGAVDLEGMIPHQFGEWREVKTAYMHMHLSPRDGEERSINQPYDQTLMRTYASNDGRVVMVALAYGRKQRQEVKVHRPELCYVAQGFELRSQHRDLLPLYAGVAVPVHRLLTTSHRRVEPVTYWIRIGESIAANAWETRLSIFTQGLKGRIPDGILVRVSSTVASVADAAAQYPVHDVFLRELFGAVENDAKRILLGEMVQS